MMKLVRCVVAALILTPAAGAAQDLGSGLEAYESGNYAAALQELRPLAERGDARAQFFLGVMYQQSHGVEHDAAEAVRWYRLAAEQGHADAQANLGFMYDLSLGVAEDAAEAIRWYQLAAEQGHAHVQWLLGRMYDQGRGVPQDFSTAHMWFNIAAANGEERAAELRDIVEGRMTADDISEAQRRARVCMESGYRECD